MASHLGGWIHSFTVTDTLTHKKGYTIYKITSIVFPRSVPEALTCITVWKRFHDIKRLHRELSRRLKSLQINGPIPEPCDCSFFKRFEPAVIEVRKKYIMQLLDFTGQHPALYKSHTFMQFFDNGHSPGCTPLHKLICAEKGNIEQICDSLDLQYYDNLSLIDPKKDNYAEAGQLVNGLENEAITRKQTEQTTKKESQCSTTCPEKTSVVRNCASLLTPMASIENKDSDYIYEAALEFSKAVQAEVNLEYSKAYNRYKRGVEALLFGSKDESNDDRKFIAKAKITKYMARADDIHEKFLLNSQNTNVTNFQLSVDIAGSKSTADGRGKSVYLERPWNNLAKFKVLQILDRVMLVQSVTECAVYVMKGIEKPSSSHSTQSLFLPQSVPYMVDLVAFFQSDQKIFLLLKQAKGGKLFDYIRSYTPVVQPRLKTSLNHIFTEVDPDVSDFSNFSVPDSGFVDCATEPSESAEFSDIMRCSQQLLKSVSNTLQKVKQISEVSKENVPTRTIPTKGYTTLPEASLKHWAQELVIAIHSLHSNGVILGDLHMDNILLGSKGQLLLSYFYQNEGFFDNNSVHKGYSFKAIDGHFVAPERPLTTKSDWWSFGVLLYQLLIGVPFKYYHPGNITMYSYVQYPDVEISDSARELLDGLLQTQPEIRMDYDKIQTHAFFAGTNWDEVLNNGINYT